MWWVIGLVVFLGLVFLIMYNSLIGRRNDVENAFATIDAMLQKRYDLIPNLVQTVKGYAKHESEVFSRVTELRARAMGGGLPSNEAVKINNEITQALGRIIAVAENYPQLKASTNFMHLQRTLTEIEEQLSAARRAFNAAVLEFNNAVQMFPTSIVAGLMGFTVRQFFQAGEKEREAPSAAGTDGR